jgi:hypothetical protein
MEFFNIATATGEFCKNGQLYDFHQIGLICRVLNWDEQPNSLREEENCWISLDSVVHQELTPFASKTISILENNRKIWRPNNRIRGKAISLTIHEDRLLACEVLEDEGFSTVNKYIDTYSLILYIIAYEIKYMGKKTRDQLQNRLALV